MKIAVAVALVAAAFGCGRKADYIDWQRMLEQSKAVPYRDTPYFPDGRVLQSPPRGTVPTERIVGQPSLTEGLEGSRYAARYPVPVTEALLARGRDRFDIFCAACHGLAGDGASVVAENMTLRRPPSLLIDPVRSYPPGRIFRVATYGYGLMAAYRTQLTVFDRWAVVAYVRALQVAQGTRLAELPGALGNEAKQALGGGP